MSEATVKILAFAAVAAIAVLAGKGLALNLGDDEMKIG